jgi:zinc protease
MLDDYPNIINKLTLNQVNAAIQKYINPKNLITVAAGTINKEGKPLEK